MKKATFILGIASGHNATACLLKDGEIVACVSEERFSGIKNHIGLPKQSIAWCLRAAGITPADVALVAIPSGFGSPLVAAQSDAVPAKFLQVIYSVIFLIRIFWRRIVYRIPQLRPVGTAAYRFIAKTYGSYLLKKEKHALAQHLNIPLEKIINTGHHLAHAATAYYASPFNTQKALVFTLDAEGDTYCATVSEFEGNRMKLLAATSRENSIGWLYHDVTRFLGMKPGEHEYKVMGLAPYAKERDVRKVFDKIKDIIRLDPKNNYRFYAKFNTQDTLYYLNREMRGVRFDILAGAVQMLVEERILEWIRHATNDTGIHTIATSGGVFMNVKTNMRIQQLPSVKKAFFMPSSGDESLAIGTAFLAYVQLTKKTHHLPKMKQLGPLYLGPSIDSAEVRTYLSKRGYMKKYAVSKPKNLERKIAELLRDGEVVARASGKMEWGARALGNRSILANPKNYDIVKIINDQMKMRDFWMPFAPSILAERLNDYCINPKGFAAPYMMVCFDSTPLAKTELRAALHPYDFTLRPQAVYKDWNPQYHAIIREFERLTGIGGVLNTSFNLHGLPIVRGPREAMHAFENSGLRHLVLGEYLISKK